jgi:hypothetical protein
VLESLAAKSKEHTVPEIAAEYVDRLITVEIRNRGMPRGITRPLYDAARLEGGGRPLTLRAAEALCAHVHRDDNVFIVTGAGRPPMMPKGENDGPVGAAVLARALLRGIGATPMYLLEPHHVEPVVAASEVAGVMAVDHATAKARRHGGVVLTAPTDGTEVARWAAAVFDTYRPTAVVCTERLGPNAKGITHNATGQRTGAPFVDFSPVVDEATRRGVLTVGVGDHGNELGFGRIADAVREIHPYGGRCQCPCGAGMASAVKTDVLVVATMSNWGMYGIEAMLAILLGQPHLPHPRAMTRRIIHACLDAGGLEAMWGTKLYLVDGAEGESSEAVVQMLGDLVRNALADPTTGPVH